MTLGKHVHKLVEINPEERRGICAACGPCGLNRNGANSWVCNRRPGPMRVQRDRSTPNGPRHLLAEIDQDARTATCEVCGPGAAVRKKREARAPSGYAWYCLTPGRYRAKHAPGKGHGLSPAEREALIEEVGGVCAICGDEGTQVDHCHSTGEIRGVLCRKCNMGIGHFRDNPALLLSAVEYLTFTPANGKAQTVRLADYHGMR